jgi:twitching motility protein PilJ
MKPIKINPFKRLLLWQRFVILGLLSVMLVGIPFYFFWQDQQERINITLREQTGLEPARELLNLVRVLPRHRGSSTGLLSGNEVLAAEEKTTKDLAEQHIAAFDALSQSIKDEDLLKVWERVKQDWPKVARGVDTRSVTPQQNFQAHTQLTAEVLEVLELVVDHYGLSLDPYAESYFLIRAVLDDGPILTEYLGQARGWGTGLLAKAATLRAQEAGKQPVPKQPAAKQVTRKGKGTAAPATTSPDPAPPQGAVTLQDRTRLGVMISLAREHLASTQREIEKSEKADPELKARLDEQLKTLSTLVDKAITLAETEIMSAEAPSYPSTDYYKQFTTAIDEVFKLIDAGLLALDEELNKQIGKSRWHQLTISGIILGIVMIGALIALYFLSTITHPVNHLVGVMDKLAAGDTGVRARLETLDEIGTLGRQFDLMVDQREAAAEKIARENDQLNNSVIALLQAVAKLSQRDLTVKVPVAEDVTGPVADAINLMADETAKVLGNVVAIANYVAQTSQQVKVQSHTVIDVATEEKREVERAAAELEAASKTMRAIAKLALSCNQAADKAIETTDKAQETVLGTVEGITSIRDTIRETEKRIKRLGERSQEIGGVVNLINSIAERTHILALNASMHAASAGEAGRGFAVVANEVQRLAENAREATSKIAALVNNIQVETSDTVTTMNKAINQVVRGTELAQQAGVQMRDTRETTAELVTLVQRIAASSENQAQMTQQLRERAVGIQKSTQHTHEQLQDQVAQTEKLVDYSEGLLESVSVFTLPKSAAEVMIPTRSEDRMSTGEVIEKRAAA